MLTCASIYFIQAYRKDTEKKGLDFYAVKDMIEEHIGRKVICECQILQDERELRRKVLTRMFGVDFGEPGKREVDVV
jgi:hypothetical protein